LGRQSRRKTEAHDAKHGKSGSVRIGRIYARVRDDELLLRLQYEPWLIPHLYSQRIKLLVHRIYGYGHKMDLDEKEKHWITSSIVLEHLRKDKQWLRKNDFELID